MFVCHRVFVIVTCLLVSLFVFCLLWFVGLLAVCCLLWFVVVVVIIVVAAVAVVVVVVVVIFVVLVVVVIIVVMVVVVCWWFFSSVVVCCLLSFVYCFAVDFLMRESKCRLCKRSSQHKYHLNFPQSA